MSEPRGFIERKHFKLRFSDLHEPFFARFILSLAKPPFSDGPTVITFTLYDLFSSFKNPDELVGKFESVVVQKTNRIEEKIADFASHLTGADVAAKSNSSSLIEYYQSQIATRLKFLKSGDSTFLKKIIEEYEIDDSHKLHRFKITFIPRHAIKLTAEALKDAVEYESKLMNLFSKKVNQPLPRIDYRLQVKFLKELLKKRQETTGEIDFSYRITESKFRHALIEDVDAENSFTMETPGSVPNSTRIILTPFLECNGFLDISDITICFLEAEPEYIDVIYHVKMPQSHNIYSVPSSGLTPENRRKMSETELIVYQAIYNQLCDHCIFGGRHQLECSFGELTQWFIRKLTYSLEEPSFLKEKAISWLDQNKTKDMIQMEDNFFLPFIYERLKDDFGDRVVKKSEKFAGEIDILFDSIPIELKVRRGKVDPIKLSKDMKYPAQAAAYAAITRLAFLVILDLPERDPRLTNINQCYSVIEREFEINQDFPTCVVALTFHCHHPKPSSLSK